MCYACNIFFCPTLAALVVFVIRSWLLRIRRFLGQSVQLPWFTVLCFQLILQKTSFEHKLASGVERIVRYIYDEALGRMQSKQATTTADLPPLVIIYQAELVLAEISSHIAVKMC